MAKTYYILVIEDDAVEQENIQYALESAISSFQVTLVASLDEGLTALRRKSFDCVVTDYSLPKSDGLYAIKYIHERYPYLPIIMLTGMGSENIATQAMKNGASDYIIKSELSSERLSISILEAIDKQGLVKTIKQQRQKLLHQAHYDTLTGLPNRLYFEQTLKRDAAHAKRHGHSLVLLLLDLDDFKHVNDLYGHSFGDMLLTAAAKRLKSVLRTEDFIARLGGDEFALILTEITSTNGAGIVAQKVLNVISSPFNINGQIIKVGASIGIAILSEPFVSCEELIKQADMAMYHSKDKGKNNYQYFSEDLDKQYQAVHKIEHAMQDAIFDNEFRLVYQPIIHLETNQICAVEALIRWKNQALGELPPTQFIPIAEETHHIEKIDHWVIQTACHQLALWQQDGVSDLIISLNVSGCDLNEALFFQLEKSANQHNISLSLIELEITESEETGQIFIEESQLPTLSRLGCHLAIDDFGTGYSSLERLRSLAFSTLKIDCGFVQKIGVCHKTEQLIKSIIMLGKNLNISVVAEGVETHEQYQFLKKHQCDKGQGFYFYQPLEANEISEVLTKNSSGNVIHLASINKQEAY